MTVLLANEDSQPVSGADTSPDLVRGGAAWLTLAMGISALATLHAVAWRRKRRQLASAA